MSQARMDDAKLGVTNLIKAEGRYKARCSPLLNQKEKSTLLLEICTEYGIGYNGFNLLEPRLVLKGIT